LFISPDLDGHRAPKKSINPERPRKLHDMFPKMKYSVQT